MSSEPAMNDAAQSDLICRICGAPKPPHHFVCRACFSQLPQNFRKSFATLKLQSLWWLREHTTQPQQPTQLNPK